MCLLVGVHTSYEVFFLPKQTQIYIEWPAQRSYWVQKHMLNNTAANDLVPPTNTSQEKKAGTMIYTNQLWLSIYETTGEIWTSTEHLITSKN